MKESKICGRKEKRVVDKKDFRKYDGIVGFCVMNELQYLDILLVVRVTPRAILPFLCTCVTPVSYSFSCGAVVIGTGFRRWITKPGFIILDFVHTFLYTYHLDLYYIKD